MADINALEAAYNAIIQATNPWAVFGDLGPDPVDGLKKIYRRLSRLVHPDQYQTDPRAFHIAGEAMRELNTHHDLAATQITGGTYGPTTSSASRPSSKSAVSEIVVDGLRYRIFDDVTEGDFCQVLRAEMENDTGLTEPVVLKIPLSFADNDLIDRETAFLQAIRHKSLPSLLGSFHLSDGRHVNVLRPIVGGYDLVAVRKQFSSGLPVEHVVWVMDRLLSVLGYIHINKAIHGAIEPGNIMITPGNHNGLLIDFVFSILNATEDSARYSGANAYTAPEVISDRNRRPHPASDMYSLGLSILYLLGGDVDRLSFPNGLDSRVKRFVGEFLSTDPALRAADAWAYHQKLKSLRVDLFGAANQFLPLHLS